MSALEVLQSFPAQRKALLKAIDGIDPTDINLIIFDLELCSFRIKELQLIAYCTSKEKYLLPTVTRVY
jgi:hypothetical protein